MPQISGPEIVVTVAVSPNYGLSVAEETKLVKASLLYADRVKLCSLAAFTIHSHLNFDKLSSQQQADLMILIFSSEALSREPNAGKMVEMFKYYKKLFTKRRISKSELLQRSQAKVEIERMWQENPKEVRDLVSNSGFQELEPAFSSGKVELTSFRSHYFTDELLMEFYETVEQTVKDPHGLPLLDGHTSELLRAAIAEDRITISQSARHKHASLAAGLFSELPAFEDATVDEILSARKSLQKYLVKFRGAMLKYAKDIESSTWDKKIEGGVQEIYLSEVAPTVEELTQAIRDNGLLKQLTLGLASKEAITGSAIGLAIGNNHLLPHLASTAVTAGVGALMGPYTEFEKWRKRRRELESNHLYLYYKAGQRFS